MDKAGLGQRDQRSGQAERRPADRLGANGGNPAKWLGPPRQCRSHAAGVTEIAGERLAEKIALGNNSQQSKITEHNMILSLMDMSCLTKYVWTGATETACSYSPHAWGPSSTRVETPRCAGAGERVTGV